jgi:hypothetical protein
LNEFISWLEMMSLVFCNIRIATRRYMSLTSVINDARTWNFGSIANVSLVPYGSIPWTSEKYSKRVSFLKPHVITVVDNEGYHLYHIDPKYKFKDLEICEKFQSMLRERELCGAFEAVEIAEADNIVSIVSRRQVIRFWQRKFPNKRPLVTMTLLQSSILDGRQHKEIDIAKFKADPEYHIPRTFPGIRRHTESNILDIFPSVLNTRTLHIKFDLVQGALNVILPRKSLKQLTRSQMPKISKKHSGLYIPQPSQITCLR